jgi:hypothetical protein
MRLGYSSLLRVQEDRVIKIKTYLALLISISLLVCLSILFIPGLAESIESWMLGFLARNAAA